MAENRKKFPIDLCVKAIDAKDINEIRTLIKKKRIIKNDIVLKLYNKDLLTDQRLQFIVENCQNELSIPISLLKKK